MSTQASWVQANLDHVNGRISAAAQAVSRDPRSITLLAVSKTFGADAVLAAARAGQHRFGENYVQEAVGKIASVRLAAPDLALEWHFIGPIQSNKTRDIAEQFDWVHSVDRAKVAERLSAQRRAMQPPLNVLLQVNVSGETSKSGAAPEAALGLAQAVVALPHLRLRGLMAIPEPHSDPVRQRVPFAALHRLFDTLRAELGAAATDWDTLSMGMSGDLEAAIAEGATMVRVGSAIFGERKART